MKEITNTIAKKIRDVISIKKGACDIPLVEEEIEILKKIVKRKGLDEQECIKITD